MSLLVKEKDLFSHLQVIEEFVFSVSQFLFSACVDWFKCTSNSDKFPCLIPHCFFIIHLESFGTVQVTPSCWTLGSVTYYYILALQTSQF